MSYIPSMEWEVEFTREFEEWWNNLSEGEQVDVNAKVILLQKLGPSLPRPHADLIHSSRHANMKELRVQHAGQTLSFAIRVRPAPLRHSADWWRQNGS
jgi:hypothetical protein